MVYAGILAGGVGTRMHSPDMPKQYMELGDKPILIHTIDPFLINPRIDGVIVAVPRPWMSHTIDLVRRHYPGQENLRVIPGGDTRNETLMCILAEIEQYRGIGDDDVIVSHDAIRPFVSDRIINDNIDAVLAHGAVDTVIPANDTIVESTDGTQITNIPLRDHMFQGQTPQSFHILTLRRLYGELTEDERAILTDTAKIFVLKGRYVHLVNGDYANLKITTPYDLKVANALLKNQLP